MLSSAFFQFRPRYNTFSMIRLLYIYIIAALKVSHVIQTLNTNTFIRDLHRLQTVNHHHSDNFHLPTNKVKHIIVLCL